METYHFAPPYELPTFPFTPPPELSGKESDRYPIVIVGAGPAGLTLACDLALRGIRTVLLDEDDTVGVRGASSRGICYAQKSLEILARLGVAERAVKKGVTWSFGRTFSGADEVYNFNLKTDNISVQPSFINLQQFYLEWFLVDRIQELGLTDLRWKNRVESIESNPDHVKVKVQTPSGQYDLEASYLIDCTGANSPISAQLGIDTHPSRSTDRWCISDVRFKKPLPVERWTWVDAPFNDGRAVWQHLMADDVWRIDYQMPEDVDAEYISRPEVAGARLREQLGPGVDFEFVWIGPYQYRDHLMDDFRSGRVFFAGDAAHVVSPFGARGGNTGIQDASNLGWKLSLVVQGLAKDSFLNSYTAERRAACEENLQVTSRSARFVAPRTPTEYSLRRAVLALARTYPFARPMVNTGRMSVANNYPVSEWLPQGGRTVQNLALQMADGGNTTLMQLLGDGTHFLALWFVPDASQTQAVLDSVKFENLPVRLVAVGGSSALPTISDVDGLLAQHLGLLPDECAGMLCLVRPDAYLAAVEQMSTTDTLPKILRTALGQN